MFRWYIVQSFILCSKISFINKQEKVCECDLMIISFLLMAIVPDPWHCISCCKLHPTSCHWGVDERWPSSQLSDDKLCTWCFLVFHLMERIGVINSLSVTMSTQTFSTFVFIEGWRGGCECPLQSGVQCWKPYPNSPKFGLNWWERETCLVVICFDSMLKLHEIISKFQPVTTRLLQGHSP